MFDGLTAVGPGGNLFLAMDILSRDAVLAGLEAGQRRLVVPETARKVQAATLYMGPGVELDPEVTAGLKQAGVRIMPLPRDARQALAFLSGLEEGTQGLALWDDRTAMGREWNRSRIPVIVLAAATARRLSLSQLAGLEEAARRFGGTLHLGGLEERQWKDPVDIYDVAA